MKLSEAIRKWKSNITTHMAAEYVLTLRADINAFSDAAQALERENAKLRKLCKDMLFQLCFQRRPQTVAESVKLSHEMYELEVRAADLGIRVAP